MTGAHRQESASSNAKFSSRTLNAGGAEPRAQGIGTERVTWSPPQRGDCPAVTIRTAPLPCASEIRGAWFRHVGRASRRRRERAGSRHRAPEGANVVQVLQILEAVTEGAETLSLA